MTDSTVTKADLVEEVVRVTELPRKESETVVETIFESIIGALQGGDRIEIRGFGSFRTRQRRGRTGRNPKTGAKVEVPPKKIPFFKPSKELKDHVNGGASAAADKAARTSRSIRAPRQFRRKTNCASGGPVRHLLRSPLNLWITFGRPGATGILLKPETSRAAFSATLPAANQDEQSLIVLRGVKNFVILNRFPYTSGHVMIVPYAHTADFAAARCGDISGNDADGAARPGGASGNLPPGGI